jgi:hypothetical protein
METWERELSMNAKIWIEENCRKNQDLEANNNEFALLN